MKRNKIEKISDKDIVLYALYLLGGWQKRIHTEDVALKSYQIAPSKFSWVKYPQYPDLAPARFALEAAKKPKYGALVDGRSERKRETTPRKLKDLLNDSKSKKISGWILTGSGLKWVESNKARIEKFLDIHIPMGDRLPADRKVKELIRSVAFKKFMDYGEQAEISHPEFAESLVCTVNTRAEVLSDRLDQLYSIAEELRKEEVKTYVNFCRNKFASLLEKKGGVKNAKS
ncbi:MAG: hypothetical protein AB1401_14250 [Thermodesulfobacteriota bacterium]